MASKADISTNLYAFRLVMLLVSILVMRVGLGFMALTTTGRSLDDGFFVHLARSAGIDGYLGMPPPPGDDLRRGDLHDDLVYDGQVVRRNGKLVVLTDADNPDGEQYVELTGGEEPEPGSAGVMVVSVLGGTTLFFAGLGVYNLAFRREEEEPVVDDDDDDDDDAPPKLEERKLVFDDDLLL